MITQTRTVHNLGPLANIPLGEGRQFKIDDRAIAVFRTRQGEVFGVQAQCPHRAGPLQDGIVGGGKVVCPLHSYEFDLRTGQPIENSCAALTTYPVFVSSSGDVLLSLERYCFDEDLPIRRAP